MASGFLGPFGWPLRVAVSGWSTDMMDKKLAGEWEKRYMDEPSVGIKMGTPNTAKRKMNKRAIKIFYQIHLI